MNDKNVAISSDEQSTERRAINRTIAVYRPVLIETDDSVGFCLLRDLSPGGMMGVVYTEFAPGRRVSVHFQADYVLSGSIAWSKDQRIGIRFDKEIDVEKLLQALSRTNLGTRVNRAPRLRIQCTGELVSEGHSLPIVLQDISQRGIKVFASPVSPRTEGIVRLEGMPPRKAVVRWAKGEMAGLSFNTPLPFDELAQWVILRQSKQSI